MNVEEIKPIYVCNESFIEKLKAAGAKINRMYMNSSNHSYYEGKRKNKRDYFLGFRAEADKQDFICFCDGRKFR